MTRAEREADIPEDVAALRRAQTGTVRADTETAQSAAARPAASDIADARMAFENGRSAAAVDTAVGDALQSVEASGVEQRSTESARLSQLPNPPLAEAPRPAMRQLAEALHRTTDGSVELTLSPEELGRVRLTLNPGDSGITVTINAERPETLDLMRRHAEMLNDAMRELGYGEVVLDFGNTGERHTADGSSDNGGEGDRVADMVAEAGTQRRDSATGTSSGLDLRL
ncbi:Flagellar hook-length control protein [Rhodovulum sp. P5]|nr:Flagellar hook-length control protein [Rhodovulum sp. P5]